MFDPFLFDTRGFEVVRSAVPQRLVDLANAEIDALQPWTRASPYLGESSGRWQRTEDALVQFVCDIGPGHLQVAPVSAWGGRLAAVMTTPSVQAVLDQLFPDGHYLDHAILSLGATGSVGLPLHGGGYERDLRQFYRFEYGSWDLGLTIVALALADSPAGAGGTALVPGSHKARLAPTGDLPDPDEFSETDWVSGVDLAAGDLLVFPEAMMHGAFPWTNPWERRVMLMKVYPGHLANLGAAQRSADGQFWPDPAR